MSPGGLFNAMISPLSNYRIKGILWYQGESNAGRPDEYRTLPPALIRDWRQNFGQACYPVYPGAASKLHGSRKENTIGKQLRLRERSPKTEALKLPATGMAVTIDIGEWNDIHPLNKKDVGARMALAARKVAFGENDLVYSGPTFERLRQRAGPK